MGVVLPWENKRNLQTLRIQQQEPTRRQNCGNLRIHFAIVGRHCNFGALKDELIRDRIVCGVRDNSMRKKLLQVPELTLDKCLDICRSAEATSTQLEAMTGQTSHAPPPPEVNKVTKTP